MIRLTLALVAALTIAGAATAATPSGGDPRVCTYQRAAQCAQAAAKLAARRHVGGPGGLWQGPSFTCSLVGPLKYSCPMGGNVYAVRFVKGAAGWKVTVTP